MRERGKYTVATNFAKYYGRENTVLRKDLGGTSNQDVEWQGNVPQEVKSNSRLERATAGEENSESRVRKETQANGRADCRGLEVKKESDEMEYSVSVK